MEFKTFTYIIRLATETNSLTDLDSYNVIRIVKPN